MSFLTITRRKVERQVDSMEAEVPGMKFLCVTVFAQNRYVEVLRAITLKNLGLKVDLTTREIRTSEPLAGY